MESANRKPSRWFYIYYVERKVITRSINSVVLHESQQKIPAKTNLRGFFATSSAASRISQFLFQLRFFFLRPSQLIEHVIDHHIISFPALIDLKEEAYGTEKKSTGMVIFWSSANFAVNLILKKISKPLYYQCVSEILRKVDFYYWRFTAKKSNLGH